jgi:tetratricopeptide (TPR) repeat protein
LDKLGRAAESLAEYREAIRLRPASAGLHNAAGSELAALGDFGEALKEFAGAERLDASYPWPHVETAKIFLKQGRDDAAVDELRAALRIAPENFQILAYTAHVLAANENAAARDGRAALTLAAKANLLAGGSQPFVFDALGMALAETGDFTNALTCAQNALDLATAAQMKNLEPIQRRLALYQARQPWRESFRVTNAPVQSGGTNP